MRKKKGARLKGDNIDFQSVYLKDYSINYFFHFFGSDYITFGSIIADILFIRWLILSVLSHFKSGPRFRIFIVLSPSKLLVLGDSRLIGKHGFDLKVDKTTSPHCVWWVKTEYQVGTHFDGLSGLLGFHCFVELYEAMPLNTQRYSKPFALEWFQIIMLWQMWFYSDKKRNYSRRPE